MSKKKGIQLMIMLLFAVTLGFTSTAAFAYWTNNAVQSNVTINFTEEEVNLVINQTSDDFKGKLVPKNYVMFEGEVEQVVFTYDISVDKTLVKEVDLLVEAINIEVDKSSEYSHLIHVTINGVEENSVNNLFNSKVLVTVVVTIEEPIDEEEALSKGIDESFVNVDDSVKAYEAIHDKMISFDLRFSIEPKRSLEE